MSESRYVVQDMADRRMVVHLGRGGVVLIDREDLVGDDWKLDPDAGLCFGAEHLADLRAALDAVALEMRNSSPVVSPSPSGRGPYR